MMNEFCCMGVTANPQFDVHKCCVCKRNHFDFFNSCKPLQNIVKVEALYLYGGCSLRQYFLVPTTNVSVEKLFSINRHCSCQQL